MSRTVGVREFRQDLADYIDGDEPVTITRHGRRVGVFIPTSEDRTEAIAAYKAATDKLQALIADEDRAVEEAVTEFEQLRKAERTGARKA